MVGWHHWLNGHEFEQILGDGEGQGSLAYCSPWGHKEWNMTQQLNNHINNICVGLPLWLSGKETTCNARDAGDICWIPGLGRFPGGGHGNPLQMLAWRITWTEEPGRLQSIRSQRVGHDWSDWAQMHTCVTELLCCNLKATQKCKSTIFQQKKIYIDYKTYSTATIMKQCFQLADTIENP